MTNRTKRKQQRGTTSDLFGKIRDIKGIFCPKMGTIKDRKSRDLVDAEEIRRDGKNTWKNCTKRF